MPRLDVGVGDEFPTEEIHRDENGVVHHHHYYRRPRRPFSFLRFVLVLVLMLLGLVLRLFREGSWIGWDLPWMPHGYFTFAGTVLSIIVVAVLLHVLHRRDPGSWY